MKPNPEYRREGSKRLNNRIVKSKLVSDLTETRERKGHPENSKCEENKNIGTHVVTQELNEQTIIILEEEIKRKNTSEKNLKDQFDSLIQELLNIKIQHRQYPNYANTKLREIFKRQRLIFKNKKRIWWEDDNIAAAVTLRSISRKVYLYLQKNVGLPLSGLSTIRKWTQAWHLNGNNLLSTTLTKIYTKDKLFEVIKELEGSGFKVVTVVSDMGGGNLSLWKNLQISTNKVSFTNLVDVTLKSWVFADLPI
ncbi:hypothetical protein PR048_033765 [Dryococelus australis]|uniref:Transposable element P transposase n=1 Tax=Dryococelus australis TaxID=614101 RepID=A0ABQ9FZZ6_9NEOP|nr:hypothetical protein PR048_033765 [Dryococelus australis]